MFWAYCILKQVVKYCAVFYLIFFETIMFNILIFFSLFLIEIKELYEISLNFVVNSELSVKILTSSDILNNDMYNM